MLLRPGFPLLHALFVFLRVPLHLLELRHALVVVFLLRHALHGLLFLLLQFLVQLVDVVVPAVRPRGIGPAGAGYGILVDGLLVQAILVRKVLFVLLDGRCVSAPVEGEGHHLRYLVHVLLQHGCLVIKAGHVLAGVQAFPLCLVLRVVILRRQVVQGFAVPLVVGLCRLQFCAPLRPLVLCSAPLDAGHNGSCLVPLLFCSLYQRCQFVHPLLDALQAVEVGVLIHQVVVCLQVRLELRQAPVVGGRIRLRRICVVCGAQCVQLRPGGGQPLLPAGQPRRHLLVPLEGRRIRNVHGVTFPTTGYFPGCPQDFSRSL